MHASVEIVGNRSDTLREPLALLDTLRNAPPAQCVCMTSAYWDATVIAIALEYAAAARCPVQLLLWTAGSTKRGWRAARDECEDPRLDLRFIDSPAESGIYHAKLTGVLDSTGSWNCAVIGSANLTDAGQHRNVELGVVIRQDPEALRTLQEWFDQQFAAATSAAHIEWERAIACAAESSEAAERKRVFAAAHLAAPSPRHTSETQSTTDDSLESGIDPDALAVCLSVLQQLDDIPVEHPQAVQVRRATARVFKTVRQRRRHERRQAVLANDKAVTEATATGAPGRIDDETQGILLESPTAAPRAGTLMQPRGCYICKERYVEVDAFYHQLCPACAAFNHARRDARTDLTGRRALLTGGRAKIGMYIALRLLRDGAHTTITTRFPNDAVRRFSAMPDASEWLHRLRIVGLDLRDPAQVTALADSVAKQGHLDILINNACQTVRRSAHAYAPLIAAEQAELPAGPRPDVIVLGRSEELGTTKPLEGAAPSHWAPTPHAVTALALTARSATPERVAAQTAIDAGGLVPDIHDSNSWVQRVNEVDPVELLEVQLCNMTAPFMLVSSLRASLAASPARRTYIVNVSAMEGQFSRGYKGPGHPHTNMAKAALNMLTRTSAQEMLESDGILMTAVDTGWITDERPHPTKVRLAETGFHAPLDLVDGAARVYDPIIRGENGEDLYGCFLKDFRVADW